jgi:hypothetical protein
MVPPDYWPQSHRFTEGKIQGTTGAIGLSFLSFLFLFVSVAGFSDLLEIQT